MHVCLCTLCVPSALRGQEKVSDPLELELEVVVSCQLGGGIRTRILRSSRYSSLTAESSLQSIIFHFKKLDQY